MGTTQSKTNPAGFFKPIEQSRALANDKIAHLKDELKGSLFPMHTKLFVERLGVESDLIKAIIEDNLDEVRPLSASISEDDAKEILLVAAFMGADKIFNSMKTKHAFVIDEDTVNIALLSGRLERKFMKDLVHNYHAGYGSIRFAIKSDRLEVVNDLMNENKHLKFGNEHLTQAVAQQNIELFDRIADTGVVPTGRFIFSLSKDNPQIQSRLAALVDAESVNKAEEGAAASHP